MMRGFILPSHIKMNSWIKRSKLLSETYLKPAKPTRGERVIMFIHRYCMVPEGKLVGQPIKLDYFQKLFILDVYDNPHGTSTAILSIARKNGKTALIAALALAHLVGPEARLNSQIVSGARVTKPPSCSSSRSRWSTSTRTSASLSAMSPPQRHSSASP